MTVDEFLAPHTPGVRSLALRICAYVQEAVPDALEQVDAPAKLVGYGIDRTYKGMICVVMPTKHGVTFGFARGTELDDPAKMLQGTGKKARHVKLTEPEELDRPELRALLDQAIELARAAVGSGEKK